jgi:hypothetical protein
MADAAREYGTAEVMVVPLCKQIAEKLSPEALRRLAEIYDRIWRQEDELLIRQWLSNASPAQRARGMPGYVVRLLMLLNALGELGVAPFNARRIDYNTPLQACGWDDLPTELHYLIGAAQKYARWRTDQDRLDFLASANEDDLYELAALWKRMRESGHAAIANRWMCGCPDDRAESAKLYGLCLLMDLADEPECDAS